MPKTIFITGASTGIGAATARAAVAAGWSVGLMARSRDKLEELRAELGDQVVTLPGDVTKLEAQERAIHQLTATFGSLDAAFANAGAGLQTPGTENGDPEEWRRRVQAVGQEAAEFGQSVEREMREAFGGRSQGPGSGAPTTYAPPPSESYNFDPFTGQPIVPARPRRPGPRWIGIALVGLGILFAAQHFGLSTDILFPLLMIGAGGAILLRK